MIYTYKISPKLPLLYQLSLPHSLILIYVRADFFFPVTSIFCISPSLKNSWDLFFLLALVFPRWFIWGNTAWR